MISETTDSYPEGFDATCGIPAWAMRAANVAAASLTGNRQWDVPCIAAAIASATNLSAPEHTVLAKFYGVKTYAELADAQAHHVERLQSKLPPTPNVFAPQRVREG